MRKFIATIIAGLAGAAALTGCTATSRGTSHPVAVQAGVAQLASSPASTTTTTTTTTAAPAPPARAPAAAPAATTTTTTTVHRSTTVKAASTTVAANPVCTTNRTASSPPCYNGQIDPNADTVMVYTVSSDGGWCVTTSQSYAEANHIPTVPASDCGPDHRYYPGGYTPPTTSTTTVAQTTTTLPPPPGS